MPLPDDLADVDASDSDESVDGIADNSGDDDLDDSKNQTVADPFNTHFQHLDEKFISRAIDTNPREWRVHKRPIAHDMTAITANPPISQDDVEFAASKNPKDLMVGFPFSTVTAPRTVLTLNRSLVETKAVKIRVGGCPKI